MKNPDLVALGAKIRSLREAAKITQEALAFDSSVDVAYLSGIECGRNNPTYLVLHRLAFVLKCKVSDFTAEVSV